jgi:hypothetical protein
MKISLAWVKKQEYLLADDPNVLLLECFAGLKGLQILVDVHLFNK